MNTILVVDNILNYRIKYVITIIHKYQQNNLNIVYNKIKNKKYLIVVLDDISVKSILFSTQENFEIGTGLNCSSDGSFNFVHWHFKSVDESVSISSKEFLEKNILSNNYK